MFPKYVWFIQMYAHAFYTLLHYSVFLVLVFHNVLELN